MREIADPNWRHPAEAEEDAADHEAVGRALKLLDMFADEMPDCPEKWGAAIAVGSRICMGRTISDIAAQIGVSRAELSHRARSFCERNNLPPSSFMRNKSFAS